MKRSCAFSVLAALLLALFAADAALARGGHGGRSHGGHFHHRPQFKHHGHLFHHKPHFRRHGGLGVFIGAPIVLGSGWYYNYPPVFTPYPAPTYIERPDEAAVPPEHWWYYCAESQRYYPYVKECPGGWQRVAPQPPPP